MRRVLLSVAAVAGIIAGIFAPVYGQLTLFQISTIPDLLYPQMYTWIAYAFAALAGLSLLAALARRLVLMGALALTGLMLWGGSYYAYRLWKEFVLQQQNLAASFMVKSLHLEWGAYAIVGGFAALLLVACIEAYSTRSARR